MTPCQHCGSHHPPGTPNCPKTGDSMSQPGLIGARLDRYELQSLLGTGGFGSVFKAKHVHTEALVALKVLKRALGADPGMVERFLREARAAAAVGSDHIVRVLDAGQGADGTPFLALELLEGVDLKDLAVQQAPLPAMRVVLLCLQVLDGLEAAHRKGIVHRDMKPANAFVVRKTDDNGTDRDFVKLLDFGISKMHAEGSTSGLTMTGVAMGTPSYMAPEQFFDARSVDARADVYSVAVMMYELLSGRLPLDASSYAELIVKVRTESPPHLSQLAATLPQPLADAVMVGLAKEKEQRWGSAKEFANALRAAVGLPMPGHTPIPPRATLGAHKPLPPVETDSMLNGKTAAPQRTPMPSSPAPATPRPPTNPPPPAQQWQVPSGPQGQLQPLSQSQQPQARPPTAPPRPQPPLAPAHVNVPASQAPVAPPPQYATPAPAQHTPAPMAPQYQAPPQKPAGSGGALKWIAIIGGGLVGLCCLCMGYGYSQGVVSSDSTPTVEAPDPQLAGSEKPAPDLDKVLDDLKIPTPPPPTGKKEKAPPADQPLDPNGHEIYDSLKLDPAGDSDVPDVITDEDLADVPTAQEIAQLATDNGMDPNMPRVKKAMVAADRFRQIARERKGKKLTAAQKKEMVDLAKQITDATDGQ